MQTDKEFLSVLKDKENLKMSVVKRRIPLKYDFLKGEEARKYITRINQLIFFYRYFETRLDIKKGDVFLVRFDYECGNELNGSHYVAAILDSNPNNQVVTVVPLKSNKGRPLNPASDVLLGQIQGLNNGKEAVAVINQIRTIDKRRLFDSSSLYSLRQYLGHEMLAEYEEIEIENKACYRLSDEQYQKINKACREFVLNGYIKHH